MLIVTGAVSGEKLTEDQLMTRIGVTIHAGDVVAKLAKSTARKAFKEQHPNAKLAIVEVIVIPFEVIEEEFMHTLATSLGDAVTAKLSKADAKMKGEKLQ